MRRLSLSAFGYQLSAAGSAGLSRAQRGAESRELKAADSREPKAESDSFLED